MQRIEFRKPVEIQLLPPAARLASIPIKGVYVLKSEPNKVSVKMPLGRPQAEKLISLASNALKTSAWNTLENKQLSLWLSLATSDLCDWLYTSLQRAKFFPILTKARHAEPASKCLELLLKLSATGRDDVTSEMVSRTLRKAITQKDLRLFGRILSVASALQDSSSLEILIDFLSGTSPLRNLLSNKPGSFARLLDSLSHFQDKRLIPIYNSYISDKRFAEVSFRGLVKVDPSSALGVLDVLVRLYGRSRRRQLLGLFEYLLKKEEEMSLPELAAVLAQVADSGGSKELTDGLIRILRKYKGISIESSYTSSLGQERPSAGRLLLQRQTTEGLEQVPVKLSDISYDILTETELFHSADVEGIRAVCEMTVEEILQ